MRLLLAAALLTLIYGCAGPSRLQVIDNVLAHEGPAPPSAPIVRELLARPLAAMQAEAIFARSVPRALVHLARASPSGPAVELKDAIEPFLDALLGARGGLPASPDIPNRLPSPAVQRASTAQAQPGPFLEALAAFRRLNVVFPAAGARFERDGVVVILGSAGDDVHELTPVRGIVRVLIDPGGDDRYVGSDMALGGYAAIIDLAGDDRYEAAGPAWGSAVSGVSLLLEVSGNDTYAAQDFSLGAALTGLGAVVDLEGNDSYRVRAFGQGLGLARGTGVLWDRAGNDRYLAAGLPDPYDRGGGLSFAQGAAVGVRTGQGGGIGILRDDAGDDAYEGELYAQGAGYYYALGLLWDFSGNDRYRAARYAQGAGVHQAVGVLRDEAGHDAYELSVGVGQGMGLDLAVGALVDVSGDDRYRAPTLAQGAATANGVGILADQGGRNVWQLEQPPGRGVAEWFRGLPSVGLVLAEAPSAPMRVAHEAASKVSCPSQGRAAPGEIPPAVALGCALHGASDAEAARLIAAADRQLEEPRFAERAAAALGSRPGPGPARQRLVDRLMRHPSCGVRSEALALDGSIAAAQEALTSGCWQLQARALDILDAHGAAPHDLSAVPRFLRDPTSRASRRAP